MQRMNPYVNTPFTETHKLLKILLVSVSSPRATPENLPICSFPRAGNFRDNSRLIHYFFNNSSALLRTCCWSVLTRNGAQMTTICKFSHNIAVFYPFNLFRICNLSRNESSASSTNKWIILWLLRCLWKLFLHLSICSSSLPSFLGDHSFHTSGASSRDRKDLV